MSAKEKHKLKFKLGGSQIEKKADKCNFSNVNDCMYV